jgi:uncharacterized protein YaeQ
MKSTAQFAATEHSQIDSSLTQQVNLKKFNFLAGLGQILAAVLRALSGTNEPQVWQKCDRSGETFWHVYDPDTRQFARFNSELEVRFWLEQRYYR